MNICPQDHQKPSESDMDLRSFSAVFAIWAIFVRDGKAWHSSAIPSRTQQRQFCGTCSETPGDTDESVASLAREA